MNQRKVLVGFLVGFFLLAGTSAVMAALWDRQCQIAIEDLQRLQQEVALKKQEVDAARVVEAIPLNFVADQLQTSIATKTKRKSQALNELKILFQNVEFAFSELSRACFKHNTVSQ